MKTLKLMIILLIVLNSDFVFSETICKDQRVSRDCEESLDKLKEDNFILNIYLKFRKRFNTGVTFDRKKELYIDQGVFRLKEISSIMCRYWNSCMEMPQWNRIHDKYVDLLLKGQNLATQRASELQTIDIQKYSEEINNLHNSLIN